MDCILRSYFDRTYLYAYHILLEVARSATRTRNLSSCPTMETGKVVPRQPRRVQPVPTARLQSGYRVQTGTRVQSLPRAPRPGRLHTICLNPGPDNAFVQALLHNITHGVELGYSGPTIFQSYPNHLSALDTSKHSLLGVVHVLGYETISCITLIKILFSLW